MALAAAIDLGGTSVKMAFVGEDGRIERKWSVPTDTSESGKNIPADIVRSLRERIAEVGADRVAGVGAGVPGAVDGGLVRRAVNIGWTGVDLGGYVERELGLPCALLNDANAAALGEMWMGEPGAGSLRDLLFVTLGTGVGGGIVIGGQALNGANSCAGEIGHIPVGGWENRVCGCGKTNCLESYGSANGLLRTAQEFAAEAGTARPGSCEEVFSRAAAGDAEMARALDVTCDILARAIGGVMCTVDVEEVVVGGGLSNAGEALMAPLAEKLDGYVFPAQRGRYRIRQAALGNDAGILGAAYQVFRTR